MNGKVQRESDAEYDYADAGGGILRVTTGTRGAILSIECESTPRNPAVEVAHKDIPALMTALAAILSDVSRPHGTRARYLTGCRCQECKSANAAYNRDLRRQLRVGPKDPDDPRHGQVSFHNAHGCRCDKCATAYRNYMRDYMRDYMRKRRSAKPESNVPKTGAKK